MPSEQSLLFAVLSSLQDTVTCSNHTDHIRVTAGNRLDAASAQRSCKLSPLSLHYWVRRPPSAAYDGSGSSVGWKRCKLSITGQPALCNCLLRAAGPAIANAYSLE